MNDKLVVVSLLDSGSENGQLLLQYLALFTFAHGAAELAYGLPLYDKTPYHTLALTGTDWVRELLNGHPEHIHNELGVHKHVFHSLIASLDQYGVTSSPQGHVSVEEQLAIFLYTCVIGLSLCHKSEQFQRSNDSTSKFVLYFITFRFGITYYKPDTL